MSDQNERFMIQFYTVCFPEYDSWSMFHGRLYQVRRDFFETRLSSQETITEFSEGMPAKYSHSISRWGMRWKKKLAGKLREYSCFDSDGSAIIMQDEEARPYGKVVFGGDLNWRRSYYYEKGTSAVKVRFLLTGNPEDNTITLTEYFDGEEPVSTRMVPRPFLQGTVEQSLINSKLGDPRICAATNQGDFCYYHEDLADRYDQWMERIQAGKESLMPAWKQENRLPGSVEPDWYQEQDRRFDQKEPVRALPPLEELGSLRSELFPMESMENADDREVIDSFSLEDSDLSRDRWVEELLHDDIVTDDPMDSELEQRHLCMEESEEDFFTVGQTKDSLEPEEPTEETPILRQNGAAGESYAANREVFHVDVSPKENEELENESFASCENEPDEDVQEIIEIIENIETAHPDSIQEDVPQQETPEWAQEERIKEVDSKEVFSEGKLPERYTVAGKTLHSGVVRASDLFKKAEDTDLSKPKEESHPIFPSITAAKRIVISAEESYYYFGKVIDGLRQGRGRTQTQDGNTAYEGNYRNDMRDGFGTYYYKSGQICYTGQWRENQRDGVGVSFQPDDASIHIGRWRNDQPVGTSAIFDNQGNLEFAGKIENGARQGAGIAYSAEDGTVFVGKWKNDIPTGEGSAFDSDGNLIYTGTWKEGKRHGTGTEFAPDGHVIFTGEWKDDKYQSGIFYKRLDQPDDKK